MWQEAVYHPRDYVDKGVLKRTRMKDIFRRDNYQCQSCRKRFPVEQLSCHHIIPRDEGGSNNPRNLITLCKPCHDEIELAEIKTVEEILYYKKRQEAMQESEEANLDIIDQITQASDGEVDWHKWVYGGGKRKQKGY